ncbi:hypothetical protein [Streptosporangium sandarakinum]|uniref:hypothetical protein n=1 Tax=Streptosporangium sandarakinum TaxID=1260955 RepID=UPI00342732AC
MGTMAKLSLAALGTALLAVPGGVCRADTAGFTAGLAAGAPVTGVRAPGAHDPGVHGPGGRGPNTRGPGAHGSGARRDDAAFRQDRAAPGRQGGTLSERRGRASAERQDASRRHAVPRRHVAAPQRDEDASTSEEAGKGRGRFAGREAVGRSRAGRMGSSKDRGGQAPSRQSQSQSAPSSGRGESAAAPDRAEDRPAVPFADRFGSRGKYGPDSAFNPAGGVNRQLKYGPFLTWPVLCGTADDPMGCMTQFVPDLGTGTPKQ